MRLFLFALLLMFAPAATAQEAPPPPAPPDELKEAPPVIEEKKVDPWAVEKPASAPEGEPIALKISMDPAVEHHMVMEFIQSMNVMGQPMDIKVKVAVQLKLGGSEAGSTNFKMPTDLQNLTARGMDQTAMAKQVMADPAFTGKFDGNGDVVAGSVRASGMSPQIESLLNSSVNAVLSFAGTRSVRKGEVWEADAAKFAPRLSGAEGGTVTGNVYMKLKGTREVDGAQCADIAGVFAITIKGATVKMPMPTPADLKIRGDYEETCGLDGVVRSRVVNLKIAITLQGNVIDVTATTKVTGSPKQAAPKTGCGGGEDGDGDGDGEEGDEGRGTGR